MHDGKKVTSIQFIDKIHAVISISDSLIRLVDMSIGKILYQYKGFTNKKIQRLELILTFVII